MKESAPSNTQKQKTGAAFYDEQTQTGPSAYPSYKRYSSTFDDVPDLSSSGSTLFKQYNSAIVHQLMSMDKSASSALRLEVADSVQKRYLFQERVFGKASPVVDCIPANIYANLIVSLYFTVQSDGFTMITSSGMNILSGNSSDDLSTIFEWISNGTLPPGLFDELRHQNLAWYDGGLICEVADRRGEEERAWRVHMVINSCDISNISSECEEEFLYAKFPLLCLEPDIQVSKVARVACRDKQSLQPPDGPQTLTEFIQSNYPELFLRNPSPHPKPVQREQPAEALKEKVFAKIKLFEEAK